MNESHAAIEVTGADGERLEYQSTSVVTVTTADLDGWAIRQKKRSSAIALVAALRSRVSTSGQAATGRGIRCLDIL